MARRKTKTPGWGFGVLALLLIFVINSCSSGKKEAKPDHHINAVVERPAVEVKKAAELQPGTLYSSAATSSTPASNTVASSKSYSSTPKSSASRKHAKPKRETKRPSQKRSYADGTCPCSRTFNCVGPRGGRYCITSGGNKRYR